MDTFHIQLALILILLLGNILFGSLPILLGKIIGHFGCSEEAWNKRVKWSTFLLYIGAGIFISDSFLVLLPQANREFADTKKHFHNETGNSLFNSPSQQDAGDSHHESFPIPEFIVLCGFFLAYVLQESVHLLCSKFNRIPRETRDLRIRFCSCAKRHTECSRTFKDARPDQTLFGLEKKLMESGNVPNSSGAAANIPLEVETNAKSELLQSSILAQAVPNYGTVTNVTELTVDNPLPVLTPPVLLAEERRLVMAQQAETRHRNKFLISSMLIVITLTLQYIFLGIHLGLRTEHIQQWPYLLVACLQNFILSFSAAAYLAVGNIEFSCGALSVGLLSTVTPIGMIAAMTDKNTAEQIPHLATGIVSAVACGTLLYTTFYEMLRQKNFACVVGMTKFLAITSGASIMIVLQYASSNL